MKSRLVKTVLVVDDEPEMRNILKDNFIDCNGKVDYPYSFEVDCASSAAECIEMVSKRSYDVIVLDVVLGDESNGLEVSFGLQQQLGFKTPIRVIFTGRPDFKQCVESMRHGAWDYVEKWDSEEGRLASLVVVDSAVGRLRQLDLLQEQEHRIAVDWLPRHIEDLQTQYGGRVIAIWHAPEIKVVASAEDAFDLEASLKSWRSAHEIWEQPFVVRIPPKEGSGSDI